MWLENQGFIDYVKSFQGQEFEPKEILKQWTIQQREAIKAQKAAEKAAVKAQKAQKAQMKQSKTKVFPEPPIETPPVQQRNLFSRFKNTNQGGNFVPQPPAVTNGVGLTSNPIATGSIPTAIPDEELKDMYKNHLSGFGFGTGGGERRIRSGRNA